MAGIKGKTGKYKHSVNQLFKKGNTLRLGIKHSEETKNKMSNSGKGKHKYWLGRKHTLEYKQNISKKLLGKNAPNWKGGITPINEKIRKSLEYRLWRNAVFERDNYTCIWCGFKGYIEADHIKPFSLFLELRFAIDNGRTLCKPCHESTDTYGGKTRKGGIISQNG